MNSLTRQMMFLWLLFVRVSSLSSLPPTWLGRLKTVAPIFDDVVTRDLTGYRRNRMYANITKLSKMSGPVLCDELFSPGNEPQKFSQYLSAPYRFTVLLSAFALFPTLITTMREMLPEVTKGDVTTVTSSFAPAISLLYGSWLGLTFSILEDRISQLQQTATQESAVLMALSERTSSVLERAKLLGCKPSANCVFMPIFEATTTLAVRSREEELIVIANNDVYNRFRKAMVAVSSDLDFRSRENPTLGSLQNEIDCCYGLVDQLMQMRADRLSKETKSLPAAHFVILSIFSVLLLGAFMYGIAQGPVSAEDPVLRVAFALFASVYLLVFTFAIDLNDPFNGNYQIRRSAINANLLSTRRLIATVVGEDTAKRWQNNNI